MKISNVNKYLIVVILFLVMAITIFFVLYGQIVTNKKVANQIEAQWKGELATQDKIRTLEDSIKEVAKERDSFESHFARSSDIVPFLDTIEGLAGGVSAKATITTVDITEDPLSLVIGINASGSFSAVYKFMMLLENASYELEIMSFDLRREGSGTDANTPNWGLTLRVKVLSFSSK